MRILHLVLEQICKGLSFLASSLVLLTSWKARCHWMLSREWLTYQMAHFGLVFTYLTDERSGGQTRSITPIPPANCFSLWTVCVDPTNNRSVRNAKRLSIDSRRSLVGICRLVNKQERKLQPSRVGRAQTRAYSMLRRYCEITRMILMSSTLETSQDSLRSQPAVN